MRQGFLFDTAKCVACNACAAACVLENGWSVRPRKVISSNPSASPELALFNFSIACNHCEKAVCMEGCPANAYSRDPHTGAVAIEVSKCLGCRYCQWNCPYGAPKYDKAARVIGKCNFCEPLLKQNMNPACVSACPTGALSLGSAAGKMTYPSWFPDTGISPSIMVKAGDDISPLRIEPADRFSAPAACDDSAAPEGKSGEASLVLFTFLSSVAASLSIASLLNGSVPSTSLTAAILTGAAFSSLFHLGKPLRAWRAILNQSSSALSREILVFFIFSVTALSSGLTGNNALIAAAAFSGAVLVLQIDSVYYYSRRSLSVLLSSGSCFLTTLLLASWLAGEMLPFVFAAALKIIFSIPALLSERIAGKNINLRLLRMMLLIIIVASLVNRTDSPRAALTAILLAGELADRILFYSNFEPVSISNTIRKQT